MDDDMFLLEAVSSGVRLIRWSNIKDYIGHEEDKFFSDVCYRKVNIERDMAMKQTFVEFANQTIGKEYSLSAEKLTRQQTVKETVEKPDEIMKLMRQAIKNNITKIDASNHGYVLIKEDRTFFCSELVAKALRVAGIMQQDDRSSAQFYPKHFGSDASENDEYLNLAYGVTID